MHWTQPECTCHDAAQPLAGVDGQHKFRRKYEIHGFHILFSLSVRNMEIFRKKNLYAETHTCIFKPLLRIIHIYLQLQMLHSHALLPILTYNHVYFAVGFEGQDGSQPPKHCRGVILFFPRLPAEEWLSLGFPQSAAGSTDSSKLWGEGCQPPSKADFSSLKICHGQLCTLQISSPFRQLIPKSLSSMQMSYFLTMF